MKKTSLIRAFIEKATSRNERNANAERARTRALRLERLESRELLSVAPGGEFLAADALAVYESSVATCSDVLDISDAMLDDAPVLRATSIVVTSEADVVDPDDDVVTLREALDAAQSGDAITFDSSLQGKTIELQLGVLTTNKSVAIDASNLLDATTSAPGLTISGLGASQILSLSQAVDVEITGIAFTNGYSTKTNEGGAITNGGATLSLVNCAISDSSSPQGGGAYFDGGKTTLTNCVVTNNAAITTFGGGLYSLGGEITLVDCVVTNNTAKYGGSGVYNDGATLSFDSCSINNNSGYSGGGLDVRSGETTLSYCVLTNNSVTNYGGAIFNNGSALSLDNCAIYGNTAQMGGAIYFLGGGTELVNCTVTNNAATRDGGGVYLAATGTSTVSGLSAYNTILVGNSATRSGADVFYSGSSNAYANAWNTLSSYSDWASGADNVVYDASKPLFTDAATGDYTLAIGSQAIDKGGNQYVAESTVVDLAGNPRFSVVTVDAGAYEFQKIKLDAPTNPRVTDRAETTFSVEWDAAENASGYRFAWKNATDSEYVYVDVIGASKTEYTLEGLVGDTTYEWKVQTVGDGISYIDSDFTDPLSVKTLKKLDAPANPTETAKTETTISVAWDAVANANGYRLAWKNASDSEYVYVDNIDSATTEYTLPDLDNGATYEWKVQALGDDVDFVNSNYTDPRTVQPRQKLAAPTNPTETTKTDATITVAWDAVANASGYRLAWKNIDASEYVYVDNIAASTTSYTIDGLAGDSTYEWKVQTLGDGVDYADSDYTEERSAATLLKLDAPTNPNVTDKTETTITVAWDAVENASGYRVVYKNKTASSYTYVTLNRASATSYTLTGLDAGAVYNWKVQALGDKVSYVNSAFCATQTARINEPTQLDAPANPREKDASGTTIVVEWDAVENATGYRFAWKNMSESSYVTDELDATTTEYALTELAIGAAYNWKVQALGDKLDYVDSEYCATQIVRTSDPVQLDAPVPTESTRTETTITASWEAVENASGYRFVWKNKADSSYTYVTVDASETSYTQTGLDANATYDWKVQAVGDKVAYLNSDFCATQTVKAIEPVDLTPPTNLRETAKTESTVSVAWDAVANANGYRLVWKNIADSSYTYVTISASTTSHTLTGLESGEAYNVKVQTLGDVNSTWSETLIVRVSEPVQLDAPVPIESTRTEATIAASWGAVENASGYRFVWKKVGGSYAYVTLGSSETSYTLTQLDNDASYQWKVLALGDKAAYLDSAYCQTQTVKPQQTETSESSAILDLGDELFDELADEDYDLLAVNFIA